MVIQFAKFRRIPASKTANVTFYFGRAILTGAPGGDGDLFWLTAALLLYVIQIAAVLVLEHRRPPKAVAWAALMLVLPPPAGGLLYWIAAREYRRRETAVRLRRKTAGGRRAESGAHGGGLMNSPAADAEDGSGLAGRLRRSLPDAALTTGNDVEVLSVAADMYPRMLADVEAARDHVHMVYYIWNDDGWGRTFRDALVRKAREGVEVRVVYDGIGAYWTPQAFWDEVRAAGGEVHAFLPVTLALFTQTINFRNHRKLTVVDGNIAYVGGINIGDEYTGADKKLGYWRDTAVRLRGGAVRELQRAFLADWEWVTGDALDAPRYFPDTRAEGGVRALVVPDGPDGERRNIFEMMFAAVVSAKRRVYATTPYFIPDGGLLAALLGAARAGLDVRIIIPGKADTKLTQWATLSYVEELLRAGVRVYRYRKGFLHAKTLIVDDLFAATGSANMDLRSLYSNFELQAAFFDGKIVARFVEDFRRDLADSEELRLAAVAVRGRRERFCEGVGRLLAPLL